MFMLPVLVLLVAVSVVPLESKHGEKDDKIGFGAFHELNLYLESKITSRDWQGNLRVAEQLIDNFQQASDTSSCLFGLCKRSKDLPPHVKAAQRFVHLLQVGHMDTSNGACSEQTLNYLDDLNRAHPEPIDTWLADNNRYHLETFGRVDRLIDEVFERLMKDCGQYVDQMYELRLSQLSESARQKIFAVSDDYISKYNQRNYDEWSTTLMKRVDSDGYKNALDKANQLGSSEPFVDYYKRAHQKILRSSCDPFERNFLDVLKQFIVLIRYAQRYKYDLNHSELAKAGLGRLSICSLINLMSESALRDHANEMFRGEKSNGSSSN